ncbi:hypothetical protein LSTR_LSTR012866 [Laodelphax striatellus]|uniref:BACK domain-containing protein n=1 Tax=Laodelphax striatellus TaxID=195883 RepID=A0A482WMV6_LAOST|nr:hypothetical protein LSTR_LSTR012866 [Laodelphax striatellus]
MAKINKDKRDSVLSEDSNTRDEPAASTSGSISEYSLSSITSHDEFFRSRRHAETSLGNMESYFINQQLTDALKLWIKHDIPNRQKYVGKLLSFIKLPLLPASVAPLNTGRAGACVVVVPPTRV